MKLQQITRGKSKYYHVYLPKNIVEHVLHWHQSDNLSYKVVNNNFVLKKMTEPVDRYLEMLSCPICYSHCVVVKVIKSSRRNDFKIVARCPLDHIPIKAFFPQSSIAEWRGYINEMVGRCDICGGILEEDLRKASRSTTRPFFKIRYACTDCRRVRVKVIAKEIMVDIEEKPPKSIIAPIIHKTLPIKQKQPIKVCPVCEESVPSDHVFCSQCGTCLIYGEF